MVAIIRTYLWHGRWYACGMRTWHADLWHAHVAGGIYASGMRTWQVVCLWHVHVAGGMPVACARGRWYACGMCTWQVVCLWHVHVAGGMPVVAGSTVFCIKIETHV